MEQRLESLRGALTNELEQLELNELFPRITLLESLEPKQCAALLQQLKSLKELILTPENLTAYLGQAKRLVQAVMALIKDLSYPEKELIGAGSKSIRNVETGFTIVDFSAPSKISLNILQFELIIKALAKALNDNKFDDKKSEIEFHYAKFLGVLKISIYSTLRDKRAAFNQSFTNDTIKAKDSDRDNYNILEDLTGMLRKISTYEDTLDHENMPLMMQDILFLIVMRVSPEDKDEVIDEDYKLTHQRRLYILEQLSSLTEEKLLQQLKIMMLPASFPELKEHNGYQNVQTMEKPVGFQDFKTIHQLLSTKVAKGKDPLQQSWGEFFRSPLHKKEDNNKMSMQQDLARIILAAHADETEKSKHRSILTQRLPYQRALEIRTLLNAMKQEMNAAGSKTLLDQTNYGRLTLQIEFIESVLFKPSSYELIGVKDSRPLLFDPARRAQRRESVGVDYAVTDDERDSGYESAATDDERDYSRTKSFGSF